MQIPGDILMKAGSEAIYNVDTFWVEMQISTTTVKNNSTIPSQTHALEPMHYTPNLRQQRRDSSTCACGHIYKDVCRNSIHNSQTLATTHMSTDKSSTVIQQNALKEMQTRIHLHE